MYSREQASKLKEEFWSTFGKYIAPQLSAEGLKINWINYKTGVKHVHFRMQADKKAGILAIELTHPDSGIRALYFEQFKELKQMLHLASGDVWIWEPDHSADDGPVISRIYKKIEPANIFDKEEWPKLISFFKPAIIALDNFWSDARYTFEALK